MALTPSAATAGPGEFVEPEVTVLHTFEGDAGLGLFGWAVSELRDIDSDGAMEVISGAPFNSVGGDKAGRVYVYSGASGASLFSFTGEPSAQLGYAIADAGDVDDDGISDILAGAPGGPGPGKAFVFSGVDGEVLMELSGESPGDSFGAAVSGAGDLDGDGVADVIVGAPGDSTMFANAGRLYAFSGESMTPLWIREGDEAGASLGSAAAALGDVNRDGDDDVLAGASGQGGAIHVLSGTDGADVYPPLFADPGGNGALGTFFAAGLPDIDDDGIPEVYGGDYADKSNGPGSGKAYVWSGESGDRLFTFTGAAAGDGLGCGRGGGDANLDGKADVSVGAYSSSSAGTRQGGVVTVYSGADGSVLRTISGTTPGEGLGFDVVTLGDVDGDRRDDLIVSAANDNRVYVIAGIGDHGPPTDSDSDSTSAGETESAGTTGYTSGTSDTATAGTTGPDVSSSGGPDESSDGETAAPETAAPETATPESATQGSDTDPAGCSCRTDRPQGSAPTGLLGLLLGGLLVLRRRPRCP